MNAADELRAWFDDYQGENKSALWRLLEEASSGRQKVKVEVYRYTDDSEEVAIYATTDPGEPVWVGLKGLVHPTWDSPLHAFCPTCGAPSCPNLKNAAVMCVGPAP